MSAPFTVSTHHASRLKFYADAARGVTEDLVAQALHGDGGHLVEAFLGCRVSAATQEYEVHVQWIGLDAVEASWEPAAAIFEDVPVLLKRFVDANPNDARVQDMWQSVQPPSSASKGKKTGRT